MRGLTQTWWSRWDCFRLREENPRKPLNIRNHCHLLILASSLGDLRRPLGHADNARMWQQLATVRFVLQFVVSQRLRVDFSCGFTSPYNARPKTIVHPRRRGTFGGTLMVREAARRQVDSAHRSRLRDSAQIVNLPPE